jgi:hypothetical protein
MGWGFAFILPRLFYMQEGEMRKDGMVDDANLCIIRWTEQSKHTEKTRNKGKGTTFKSNLTRSGKYLFICMYS